jgi:hypothetical protein
VCVGGWGGGGERHREGYDGGVEASLRCEVPCEWHSLLSLFAAAAADWMKIVFTNQTLTD